MLNLCKISSHFISFHIRYLKEFRKSISIIEKTHAESIIIDVGYYQHYVFTGNLYILTYDTGGS